MNVIENVSVVVVSKGNNPSILNQDFLERNDIVPAGWGVKEVIVTPPLSLVRYAEGLTVQMEENKVTFAAYNPEAFDWEQILPNVARRFLGVLPHVSYGSVGINFQVASDVIQGKEAEEKLIGSVLTPGDWQGHMGGITGCVVELQFRNSSPNFNVKVGIREVLTEDGPELLGPVINGNFHLACAPGETEKRSSFISGITEYKDNLFKFIDLLPVLKQ